MFAASNKALKAYKQVGVETDIAGADPHKLILLLFDGARTCITKAKMHMQQNAVAAKGEAISMAISIIDQGLRASLNVKAGGKLAEKLDALYAYMSRRLLVANLRNQPELLDEVAALLRELHEGWAAIGTPGNPAGASNAGSSGPTASKSQLANGTLS